MSDKNSINFKSISFKNFMTAGNVASQLSLDGNKATLIRGMNGAGKSTILEAIIFALYGKPFRKITKGQLINSVNKKDCVVEIEFSKGLENYNIVRGISPNIFEVYHNGKAMPALSSATLMQDHLEENIIGMSMKTFCQIVILGAASYTPFMRLAAAERRQFIELLLDLNVFTQMNAILKTMLDSHKAELTESKNALALISMRIKGLEEQRIAIESMLTQNKDSIQRKIDINKQAMVELIEEVKAINLEMAETVDSFDVEAEPKLETKINKIHGIRGQLASSVSSLTKQNDFLQNHSDCPTCNQPISNDFKITVMENANDSILKAKDGLTKLDESLDKMQTEKRALQVIKDKLSELKVQKASKMSRMENLKEGIQNLLVSMKEEEGRTEVSFDYTALNDENDKEKVAIAALDKLEEKTKLYTAAGLMLKDGGVKALIIKRYIPKLNQMIAFYLDKLNLYVDFNLDENFDETIKSAHRDKFTYESFSEGEKLRIDLALLFAWRQLASARNSADTNLLIMDEILDRSLDGPGVQDFLGIIKDVAKEANVVIISHKGDNVSDLFDRVIEVKKVGGFAEYQEFSQNVDFSEESS